MVVKPEDGPSQQTSIVLVRGYHYRHSVRRDLQLADCIAIPPWITADSGRVQALCYLANECLLSPTPIYKGQAIAPDHAFVGEATFLVWAEEDGASYNLFSLVAVLEGLDRAHLA